MEKQIPDTFQEAKYDVFISYSRKDYADEDGTPDPHSPVAALIDFLDKHDISYWIDKEGVYSGSRFSELIVNAIGESKMMIFVSSESSNESVWTEGEVYEALDTGKHIIPFRIDETPYSSRIRIRLGPLDRIDYFTNPDLSFEKLLKGITAGKEEYGKKLNEKKIGLKRRQIASEKEGYYQHLSQLRLKSDEIVRMCQDIGETCKTCPVCGGSVPLPDTFCGHCGWSFTPPFEVRPGVDENHLFAARSVWNDLRRRTETAGKEEEKLNGRISELEKQIEGLKAVKKELEAENAEEKDRVKAVESKLAETENLRMESERVSAGLRETIDKCNQLIKDGKEQIARKDGIIAQLGEKCSKSEAEIRRLTKTVFENDARLREGKEQIARNDGIIALLRKECRESEDKIQRLSKTISENDARLREEKKQTATKDELIKRLNEKCTRMGSELEKYKEAERRAEAERIKAEQAKIMMALKAEAERKAKEERAKKIAASFTGHGYVDLGLPSGTLWATCNVGASKPSDYGDYFAWGETKPKNSYKWVNLKYCNKSTGDSFSKYNVDQVGTKDRKKVLELSDDAAHVQWGGAWRMPTHEEWVELRDYCDWKLTAQDGCNGYKVTSKKNGASIFLPAAGWRDGESRSSEGVYGFYWSSSLYSDYSYDAFYCFFNSVAVYPSYWSDRFYGLSVRPVASSLQ